MIIPSIDIMDGKAVKLVRGKEGTSRYFEDPLRLAEEYSLYPEVNLIDLDAAFGKGENTELLKKLCRICDCNVGGGIRSFGKADGLLKVGAKKIIIGTSANKEFLRQLAKEKLIVAIDSKQGKVVDKGWTSSTDMTPAERVFELQDYCSSFIYTYVDKEGLMQGIDIDTVKTLKKITNNRIIYAGGVSTVEEIMQLEKLGVDSVLGMSLYTKKISLPLAFAETIDFGKGKGLVPTIVQEENGQVMMLAYSNKESLTKALEEKKGVYYSRSRQILWTKGETSGNTQELFKIKVDCDKDTLLFIVRQKNKACHTGKYSCFGDEVFSVNKLYKIIKDRNDNPKIGSYTNRLLDDEKEIMAKIKEESSEVTLYKDLDNLRWEIADLLYFVNVLMVKKGLDWKDIERELEGRHRLKK